MKDIETERLLLRLVPLAGLAASAAKDAEATQRLIGLNLPEEWFAESWVSELRLNQWKNDPEYGPWSIRAVALKETGQIVGNFNCHDRPRPFQFHDQSGLAVEMGYTIFEPWRRQGFAFEMINAFMAHARVQNVRWVLLSVSPENQLSLALARKLGAEHIGSQIDEKDGPEDIFLIEL